MQTLSDSPSDNQVKEWLDARGILAEPYARHNPANAHYWQLSVPEAAGGCVALPRNLIGAAEPQGEALLHFTNWSGYYPNEMAVVTAIRRAFGEGRPLIDSPGHHFDGSEFDLLAGMAGLCLSFGWTAYVYFKGGLTFLLWEGCIIDVWLPGRHSDLEQFIAQHLRDHPHPPDR